MRRKGVRRGGGGGHLDALQWLRAADCRWDVQTMIEAAEAGEFES